MPWPGFQADGAPEWIAASLWCQSWWLSELSSLPLCLFSRARDSCCLLSWRWALYVFAWSLPNCPGSPDLFLLETFLVSGLLDSPGTSSPAFVPQVIAFGEGKDVGQLDMQQSKGVSMLEPYLQQFKQPVGGTCAVLHHLGLAGGASCFVCQESIGFFITEIGEAYVSFLAYLWRVETNTHSIQRVSDVSNWEFSSSYNCVEWTELRKRGDTILKNPLCYTS